MEQLNKDAGDKVLVFGSTSVMSCAQSLFLLKHHGIPDFAKHYLALGKDKDMLPEAKFSAMEQEHPDLYGRHTIIGDRDRPIQWNIRPKCYQQMTNEEIDEWMQKLSYMP